MLWTLLGHGTPNIMRSIHKGFYLFQGCATLITTLYDLAVSGLIILYSKQRYYWTTDLLFIGSIYYVTYQSIENPCPTIFLGFLIQIQRPQLFFFNLSSNQKANFFRKNETFWSINFECIKLSFFPFTYEFNGQTVRIVDFYAWVLDCKHQFLKYLYFIVQRNDF